MTTKALLLGSIGVLAETSDIQRRAYNQAFQDHGLDWHWSAETYRYLLRFVGGQARMRLLSDATGAALSDALISDIHAHKTKLAGAMVKQEVSFPRPGVIEAIAAAKQSGILCGIVTSTQRANIDAIADAAGVDLGDMDVVVTQEDVTAGKPSPEPYLFALEKLGIRPAEAIAVEDTAASLQSAVDARIETIATPGAYALDQDFRFASLVAPSLLLEDGALIQALAAHFKVKVAA
ncbi:MAG: HAD-IA family hydrolase [Pseudomonadota bacterium]